MGIPVNVEERFDILSFARQIKNIGRAYQRQAIELVNLCRMFIEKFSPEKRHNSMPKMTMLAIHEALRLAEVAGMKVTDKATAAFQDAKMKLLRYRAIVHPGLQSVNATITEGLARAKEKDEQSLELFNQILKRRGPNETSPVLNTKARIRIRNTDRLVDTKAQVACSHTVVAPTGTSHAPSALTHAKVEKGQYSSMDHRYTPSSPHTLILRVSLASISRRRPTAVSCSTTTTTPVSVAPGASGSLEAPKHRSSSSRTVTPPIQQSSCESGGPRGIQPPIVQERPEDVSLHPSGIPPYLPVAPSSHSPPQSSHIDPSPNPIDVAPIVNSERQKGASTRHSPNSLPQSEEKKISPTFSQTKTKRSIKASVIPKPSTKFVPFSLTASHPGPPDTRKEAPSRLMMPGTFPGTSLDDMDMSSWVLVSPVSPDQVEVSKRSWFKRMFSRLG